MRNWTRAAAEVTGKRVDRALSVFLGGGINKISSFLLVANSRLLAAIDSGSGGLGNLPMFVLSLHGAKLRLCVPASPLKSGLRWSQPDIFPGSFLVAGR
jgi:hypothetical protein